MAVALKNYTTVVPVDRTLAEIGRMLVRAGASDVLTSYDAQRRVSAIKFLLPTPYGQQLFALPARVEAVQRVLVAQKTSGRMRTSINTSREHAERVAWRIIRDWLDAQLALIETQQATADQVLLPYRVLEGGQSMYEAIVARQGQLPATVAVPLLPEGRG